MSGHRDPHTGYQCRRGLAPSLRKIIKTRGSFPNDDAALKLLYLAIKNARLRWRRGTDWTAAMGQFAIQFAERFPGTAR
jgi:putative transposase